MQDHVVRRETAKWRRHNRAADAAQKTLDKGNEAVSQFKQQLDAAKNVAGQRSTLEEILEENVKQQKRRTPKSLDAVLGTAELNRMNSGLGAILNPSIPMPYYDETAIKGELRKAEQLVKQQGELVAAKRPPAKLDTIVEAARKRAVENPHLREGRNARVPGTRIPLQQFLNKQVSAVGEKGAVTKAPARRVAFTRGLPTLLAAAAPLAISSLFGNGSGSGSDQILAAGQEARDWVRGSSKD